MHDELAERTDVTIARLTAHIEAQAAVIRRQAAELAHSRKIFDRSSAAARIGVWECDLSDNSLTWTDVVYDLFDLPRGAPLRRDDIVACYQPASAAELHEKRSRAIAEQTGFSMDAEIVTLLGNRRWIRINAVVESERGAPVRIFGMKQDITDAKMLLDRTRYLAEFDVMTGLANRARFQTELDVLSGGAPGAPRLSALMLVDLDGFKGINDTHGHAVGDLCLREMAARLSHVCAGAALVSRIGGDEFAVLFDDRSDLGSVAETARAVLTALAAPIGLSLALGASIGIAAADGCDPSDLFIQADNALYAAKNAGRNTFRIYKPGQAPVESSGRAA